MKRIVYMVIRLFLLAPYYVIKIALIGRIQKNGYEKGYRLCQHVTKMANEAGKVTIDSEGIENLPIKDGFILFPNHQGMFDVLAFLESCPVPFAFVIKKEASNVILLKQVIKATGSLAIDREDIRQSMGVILKMSEEVKKGRNFLIFPEGTRSRKGNELLPFKAGSFKCAMKAKCPIVPCALIDAYKPFDEASVEPVTVKLMYLSPLYYEDYKNMNTVEIAKEVENRIRNAIKKEIIKNN